jgi:hypothetical protein
MSREHADVLEGAAIKVAALEADARDVAEYTHNLIGALEEQYGLSAEDVAARQACERLLKLLPAGVDPELVEPGS